jgi:Putative abortive phage resistance protein AbiGi, antitoxin
MERAMLATQRYVSDELTHFVGRQSTSTPDEKYNLLIKILKAGWLTHPPHNPSNTERSLHFNYGTRLSENKMYNTGVVCFCDIPISDFDIHMRKYSTFGLSFNKSTLISKGANPVFYIANNSRLKLANPMTEHDREPPGVQIAKTPPSRTDVTRAQFFDEAIIEFTQYLAAFQILCQKGKFDLEARLISSLKEYISALPLTTPEEKQEEVAFSAALGIFATRSHIPLTQRFYEMFEFIELYILAFLKLFDDTKSDDDPDNYYMEREWRIVGNVQFDLQDVRRIILPETYAKRLRTDLPTYYGQLSFSQ